MFEIELSYKSPHTAQNNPHQGSHFEFLVQGYRDQIFDKIKVVADGTAETIIINVKTQLDEKGLHERMSRDPLVLNGIATFKIKTYPKEINLSDFDEFILAKFVYHLWTRQKEEMLGISSVEKKIVYDSTYRGYPLEWCDQFIQGIHAILSIESYKNTVALTYLGSEQCKSDLKTHREHQEKILQACQTAFLACLHWERAKASESDSKSHDEERKKLRETLEKIRKHRFYSEYFQKLELPTDVNSPTSTIITSTPTTSTTVKTLQAALTELQDGFLHLEFRIAVIELYTAAPNKLQTPEFSDKSLLLNYGHGATGNRRTDPVMDFCQNAVDYYPKTLSFGGRRDYRLNLSDTYQTVVLLRANIEKLVVRLSQHIAKPHESKVPSEDLIQSFLDAILGVQRKLNIRVMLCRAVINKENRRNKFRHDRTDLQEEDFAFRETTKEIEELHKSLLNLINSLPLLDQLNVMVDTARQQTVSKLLTINSLFLVNRQPLFMSNKFIVKALLTNSLEELQKKTLEDPKIKYIRSIIKGMVRNACEEVEKKSNKETNDKPKLAGITRKRPSSISTNAPPNSAALAIPAAHTIRKEREVLSAVTSPLTANKSDQPDSEPNTAQQSANNGFWDKMVGRLKEIMTPKTASVRKLKPNIVANSPGLATRQILIAFTNSAAAASTTPAAVAAPFLTVTNDTKQDVSAPNIIL